MRLIDADAFDKCLVGAEIEATKSQKYVFSSAINTIRGNLANFPTVNQWIPFHKRELTEEEQEMYPEWSYYLDCELPEDGEEILISSPTWGVYKDTFNNEGSDGCYLEGCEEIDDGMAWMPLPEPWGGDSDE